MHVVRKLRQRFSFQLSKSMKLVYNLTYNVLLLYPHWPPEVRQPSSDEVPIRSTILSDHID